MLSLTVTVVLSTQSIWHQRFSCCSPPHQAVLSRQSSYLTRVRYTCLKVLWRLVFGSGLDMCGAWRHDLLSFSIASAQISHISNPLVRQVNRVSSSYQPLVQPQSSVPHWAALWYTQLYLVIKVLNIQKKSCQGLGNDAITKKIKKVYPNLIYHGKWWTSLFQSLQSCKCSLQGRIFAVLAWALTHTTNRVHSFQIF